MEGRCAKHLFEGAEDRCGKCGEEFCGECLVYAFGPKKPPYCIPCAVAAAGIRANAGNRPVVGKNDLKRLEKERKSAFKRFRRERTPDPVSEPATPDMPTPVVPAPAMPAPVVPEPVMPEVVPAAMSELPSDWPAPAETTGWPAPAEVSGWTERTPWPDEPTVAPPEPAFARPYADLSYDEPTPTLPIPGA